MSENEISDNDKFIDGAKDYRGWDLASESFRLGSKKWIVVKSCKTVENEEILRVLSTKIDDAKKALKNGEITGDEGLKIARTSNKEILEKTLTGFNYDTEVKEFGHVTLASVSLEMQSLFLVIGGFEELIYKLKLQRDGEKRLSQLVKVSQNG